MIIGIGGCSNSGKSALAKELETYYFNHNVKILCQDDFVKRRDYLTKIDEHVNWEIPSTIKIEDYISAVKEAVKENDIVICEGLFAFWFEDLNKLYDKCIFLDIDKENFISRKKNDFRWGKESEWYMNHIWDSYLKYGKLSQTVKNFLIMNIGEIIKIEKIIEFINL